MFSIPSIRHVRHSGVRHSSPCPRNRLHARSSTAVSVKQFSRGADTAVSLRQWADVDMHDAEVTAARVTAHRMGAVFRAKYLTTPVRIAAVCLHQSVALSAPLCIGPFVSLSVYSSVIITVQFIYAICTSVIV